MVKLDLEGLRAMLARAELEFGAANQRIVEISPVDLSYAPGFQGKRCAKFHSNLM